MLVGHSPGLNHNEFLATTRSYGDFILSLKFRLVDGQGNSGVQFRSVRIPPHEMSGYQADIGENYWGCLYDESRRNKVLVSPRPSRSSRSRRRAGIDTSSAPWAIGSPDAQRSGLGRQYREADSEIARARADWPCRSTPAGRWRSSSRM